MKGRYNEKDITSMNKKLMKFCFVEHDYLLVKYCAGKMLEEIKEKKTVEKMVKYYTRELEKLKKEEKVKR